MKTLLCVLAGMIMLSGPVFAETDSEKAQRFFEDAFAETLARDPMMEARLRIKDRYDLWNDISDDYTLETRAIIARQLSELRASINYDELDERAALSYDLFVDDATNRIEAIEWRHHNYTVDQMYGWQSRLPSFLINIHKVDTPADAEAYIARLERIEIFIDQVIEGLEIRQSKGIIAPRFVFPHVISDSRNVISGKPFDGDADCALLADFKEKVAALSLDGDDNEDLIARATTALLESVGPSYERLIDHLEHLETKATTDDGIWKLPDGEAYYEYRLRTMTTTSMSPTEVHQLGLSEVARIHDEMRSIMRAVGFKGDLREFFEFMRTDEQFYFPDTDEGRAAYLDGATKIIDAMRSQLDHLFGVKPQSKIVVKAVEPFREKSAGKAFYESPAPDGSRPGKYYANLYRMEDMPTYQMEALAFHEGIPGHHMQRAISIEMEGLPMFRKYARYTAYTEGWALYTEYIPKEIGFYKDPYSDFGRLAMELWRACRLVVDTGIHDKRWTREKAIEYLDENTPNPHGDAVKAIERYIVMPGQVTAYKIGMIRILQLRERAKAQLGEDFDIRGFHDTVLENGPVPLSTLEKIVDEWTAEQLSRR